MADAPNTITVKTEFIDGQKPGIKTTEFWITAIFGSGGTILLLMKALGLIDKSVDTEAAEPIIAQIGEQLIVIIGLITTAGVSLGYISARKTVKTETAKAVGMAALMKSQDD